MIIIKIENNPINACINITNKIDEINKIIPKMIYPSLIQLETINNLLESCNDKEEINKLLNIKIGLISNYILLIKSYVYGKKIILNKLNLEYIYEKQENHDTNYIKEIIEDTKKDINEFNKEIDHYQTLKFEVIKTNSLNNIKYMD